ncbi:MAG TPA: hypothetical protein VKB23_00350 [Solirubrobacterales bacterium]|nr:hypothetical protein [Solirubrobacterales bacterium]
MVGGPLVAPASGELRDDLLPTIQTRFVARATPMPMPSEGRIPVRLRLLDQISTTDGSHLPATQVIQVDLDRQFGVHLARVESCPSGLHYDIRTPEDPCAKVKFGTGTITFEVAFPEQQPVSVVGRAIAFKQGPGKVTIRAYLPAPIVGQIAIPITVGRKAEGRYGIKLTAAVPKIAGGSGSVTSLDMRFRKGIFSVACPEGRFQSRVTNSFADGSVVGAGVITTC